jgi:cob(I)alamin adenosyltransferase
METQTIINVGLGIILTIVGWFARQIWENVQRIQRDLHEIEVDLPTHYVQKSDYTETMKRIEIMFERIFDKLEQKADR